MRQAGGSPIGTRRPAKTDPIAHMLRPSTFNYLMAELETQDEN